MSKKTIPSLRGRGGYKSNAPGSPKKGKKEGGKGRILLSRLIPLGVVLLLAAVGGAALALLRTQPVWYVAEEYAAAWADILDSTKAPFSRVKPYPGEGKIPKNRYGYIITGTLEAPGFSEAGDPASEIPLRIYPGLSRSREYRGALVLALNPWMVFRKYQDPDLIRSRIDAAGGEPGRLLLPGGDIRAAWAWMAQLLQNPPGTFPPRGEEWDPARLFRSHRFQQGAATYTWEDAWAFFFMDDLSWIYAPLQMVREFPPYQLGRLRAARFPERKDWTEFGIQAEILWAVPFTGKEKDAASLGEITAWLKDAQTQTIIANRLNWIPAHPGGTPFNPVSWEAQLAWISSSFVWQMED